MKIERDKRMIEPKWLGETFYQYLDQEPRLLLGYKLPDYPELRSHAEESAHLIDHSGRSFAVLRRDNEGIEMDCVERGNMNHYVAVRLLLRLLHNENVNVADAFAGIVSRCTLADGPT